MCKSLIKMFSIVSMVLIGSASAEEVSPLVRQRVIFGSYSALLEKCFKDNGSTFNAAAAQCGDRASETMRKRLSAERKEAKTTMLEGLSYDGYASIGKTYAKGKFTGCSIVGAILLEDGSIFICDPSSPTKLYSPLEDIEHAEVLILKNATSGKIILLVDNVLLEGQLRRNH